MVTRRKMLASALLCSTVNAALRASAGEAPGRSHVVAIENRASGGVLEVPPDAIGKNGARVMQNKLVPGRSTQEWILTLVESPDIYRIESRAASGKVLDAEHFTNNANGAIVQTWDWRADQAPNPNQRWRITALGNSFFRITNVESARVLDLDTNRIFEKDATITVWDWHDGTAAWQEWRLLTR